MQWSQKAGGGGQPIQTSATCGTAVACTATDGGAYRLHSAVLQSSTVLYAASGSWQLTSGYMNSFPPRPLVQCRSNSNTTNCASWENDTSFNFRNDRGCTSNCAFSKGALHYYKYLFSLNSTETEAAVDAGTKWSDTAAYCPGGTCDKTGTLISQAIGGETATGYYIHVNTYNGGMKGGRETYGPFKIDQTAPNAPVINNLSAGDWLSANLTINISDTDTGGAQSGVPSGSNCDMAVLSNGTYTVNDASWGTTLNRTCNSSSSYGLTVGAATPCDSTAANKCCSRGKDKCEVKARSRDTAGNLSAVTSRIISADWNIAYINNTVTGSVKGYPASAANSGGAYIGTYVDADDTVYLLNDTATILDSTALGSGGTIVGQMWSYTGTSNYLWVVTSNGKVYKMENVGGTELCDPGETAGCAFSGAVHKQLNSTSCVPDNNNATATSPLTAVNDAEAIWVAGKDADCGVTERLYAVETSANSVTGGGTIDIVVDEPACAENQVSSTPKVVRGTAWADASNPTVAHFGTDCDGAANNVKVLRISTNTAAKAACSKDVLGTDIQAWMTGPAGYLAFGTLDTVSPSPSERGFYMLSGTEDAACGTVYATVAGFPSQDMEAPAGADIGDVSQGVKVNTLSNQDEGYFVTDDGKLHCVCTKTTTDASTCVVAAANQCDGSPAVGQSCTGFPVTLESGVPLREQLVVDGVAYVLSNTGHVYAVEGLCDPTADDGVNPGTVKTANGYGATAATFNLGVTITSSTSLVNNGTKRVSLGTDSGKVFYLPVTP